MFLEIEDLEYCTGPGQCSGIFLTEVATSSIDDCLSECQGYVGFDFDGDGEPDQECTWFTYDSLIQGCKLFNSCDRLTDSCSTCTSGSIHCGPKSPSISGGDYENSFKGLIKLIVKKIIFQATPKLLLLVGIIEVDIFQIWSS